LPPAPAPAAPVPAPATAPAAAPAPAPAAAVTPPRLDASYRGNPPPAYPLASRRHHETGTVRLRLLVQADGQVGAVEVLRSSGFPRLDQAAVAAVRQWRLLPARRGETAVAAWYELPLTFQLEN
jgi:protein TonB